MRRLKRDRKRSIPITDLQQVSKFRAELSLYAKFRGNGMTHQEAMRMLYSDGGRK